MSSAREGKRNSRPKTKAIRHGLTLDTRAAQDSYKVENSNLAVQENSNGKLAMPSNRENKKDSRARPNTKGLSLDTKFAQDSYKVVSPGVAIDTRLARNPSNVDVPRLSEAMMNTNWRNPRRAPEEGNLDTMDPPWSAPPEQSKLLAEAKNRPQRDDDHGVMNYDHSLKRVAYRCSRPEDVKPELIPFTRPDSVDPELCLSAPATKMEFSTAEVGTEERASKYNPSVFQPSVKSLVRLDKMAPIKRAGYEKILDWDEGYVDFKWNKYEGLRNTSSITTVSIVGPCSALSSSWETLEFPYAEIRAVESSKKFETGLSDVEETIRNQLSVLMEPQTAGLPPAYLRKEYEEIREERRRAMTLAQSTLGPQGHRRGVVSNKEAPGREGNDTQFNNLLGKLNKLCAHRLRAFTVNDRNSAYDPNATNRTGDTEKGSPQRSPSGDSGIGGLSPLKGRKRSSTLNPKAVEFRYSPLEMPSLVVNGCNSSPVQASKQISEEPVDPIRRLETRVAELEAQLALQQPQKAQFVPQKQANGCKTYQASHGAKGYGSKTKIPGGGMRHAAMIKDIQGPANYQAAHPPPSYQPRVDFATRTGGMFSNPMPVTGPCGLPQNGTALPSNGIPTGLIDQCSAAQTVIPFGNHATLMAAQPASNTPLWVKSMFGPKPVSKPDRPFNPGDGIQAMRQQQYEEYLEHLRTTDPSYALNCKQRQARRADRQRLGPRVGHSSGQKVLC
ncbi:hypothetical protein NUW58_g5770 [Xylaria curta]|uniref:Uncharacterized protein n=1 Tax=Xylaria curta TaxID=42375 RepID=A0ACC1P325_9PEZI|nr:hypothetical protein NUW58_g5770 [Xylaria curta]